MAAIGVMFMGQKLAGANPMHIIWGIASSVTFMQGYDLSDIYLANRAAHAYRYAIYILAQQNV